MSEENHNGWATRWTRSIYLHLAGDPETCRHWVGRASEAIASVRDEHGGKPSMRDRMVSKLAREIRETIHEDCMEDLEGLQRDLMASMMAEVDWSQLAREFINRSFEEGSNE